ncbi:MAG: hypothetical protein ACREKE_06675, partial [bacterium]
RKKTQKIRNLRRPEMARLLVRVAAEAVKNAVVVAAAEDVGVARSAGLQRLRSTAAKAPKALGVAQSGSRAGNTALAGTSIEIGTRPTWL